MWHPWRSQVMAMAAPWRCRPSRCGSLRSNALNWQEGGGAFALLLQGFKLLEDSRYHNRPRGHTRTTLARKRAARLLSVALPPLHTTTRSATGPTGPWGPAYDSTQRDRRHTRDRHAIFVIYLLDRVAVRMSRCSTRPAATAGIAGRAGRP